MYDEYKTTYGREILKATVFDPALFGDHLKETTNLKPSSIYFYVSVIKQFIQPGLDLNSVFNYSKFLNRTSQQHKNYANKFALLKFINWKIKDKKIKNEIITFINEKEIVLQSPNPKGPKLTDDELSNVIISMEEKKHKVISYIQSLTGIRVGDCFNVLQGNVYIDDMYPDALCIETMTKGNKKRKVYIWRKEFAKYIYDFCQETDYRTGFQFMQTFKHVNCSTPLALKKANYHRYYRDLKEALYSCGIIHKNFSPHHFRYYFAQKAWALKPDIIRVKELLGHSSITTTYRYLRDEGLIAAEGMKEAQLSER